MNGRGSISWAAPASRVKHFPEPTHMKTKPRGLLIGFGLAGHGIDFLPEEMPEGLSSHGSHLSGYEDPESFQRRFAAGDYAGYDLENAIVVDKRARLSEFPGLAISSPMVRTTLPPKCIDRFADACGGSLILDAMRTFPEFAAQWGIVGAIAVAESEPGRPRVSEPGGMDFVDVGTYADWWRRRGARLGVFRNGVIEWATPDPDEVTASAEQLAFVL